MTDEWEGLEYVLAAITKETDSLSEAVLTILSNCGEDTLSDADGLVPERSGDLKSTGDIDIERDASSIKIEVSYGDGNRYTKYGITDGYSWFQEFGTSKMAAQPYLGPAFESNALYAEDLLNELLGGGVNIHYKLRAAGQ